MSFVESNASTTLKGKEMTFPKQAELAALGKRVSDGLSKEELDKLFSLTAEKSEWGANQIKKVKDIVTLIQMEKISLTSLIENQAYTKNDLKLAAARFGIIKSDQNDDVDTTKSDDSGKTRKQKTGPVVFTFESVGGLRSALIRQDSTLPQTPNESHLAFFMKPGSTKEKLMKLQEKNAQNAEFLKSDDGKKLINEWVNWFDVKVKSYVEKHPEKVPAKA